MIIARKIAYNVAFSSFSKILSTVLALVSIGLITRYLGREGFGNYATALAFLSFFSALADLGLCSVSTREISRPGADEKKIMGNAFALRIVVSAIILFLSPFLIFFFPYSSEVKLAIIIVAASFFFSSSYQIFNGVFQKNLAIDKIAITELSGKILQVLVIFLAIKMEGGFLWIISSLLFFMIFNFISIYFWSKKYISFSLNFDFSYWRKFLKESYPIGLSALVAFVYFKMDTILLSLMKDSSEVGIYGAAYKVIENITFFPAMIIGLIFPIMSENIFHNWKRFTDISDKTFKIFWVLIIPLVVGTLFFSEEIMSLIGGAAFSDSSRALQILIFALAFIFFGNFFNATLIAGNQQKKLLVIFVLAAVFNLSANLIFIPRYSYLAAAVVSALTEFFVAGAGFYITVKQIKYFPRAENFFSILASGGIMAVFIFIFKEMNFFLLGFSSVIIYIISLAALKAIKKEEILSIVKKGKIGSYGELS